MRRNKLILLGLLTLFSMSLVACEEGTTVELDDEDVDVDEIDTTPDEEDENVSQVVYPAGEVIEVNIQIDEADYQDLLANAMDEEYYEADITYNGYTLTNVGVRAKGNSSLKDVFQNGGDRFSFNIDLNLYEDQDLFGIDKLILNNMYMDSTYMAEFLAYEALESLDATTSRTTYTALYINGEYFGLYLSVEHIGNEFLDTNFGNSDGEFYKPETGPGATLEYEGDDYNYSALIDKNAEEETDNELIIDLMSRLESGDNIDDIFDVEGYLKYLAVSTYTVNLDSYQGGMSHNYYLYNNAGTFEWIGWDLNMAFNGFPMSNLSDSDAIGFLIDEPTSSSLSNFPLIEAILSNESYLEIYHGYLEELVTGYFYPDTFSDRVDEVYALINEYVETDPSSFYSYQDFIASIYTDSATSYSIIQFVEERTANVLMQINGTIPSTNNGEGNGLSGGMGGMPGGNPGGDAPTRRP